MRRLIPAETLQRPAMFSEKLGYGIRNFDSLGPG